jgi:hypothetical protein
MAKHLPAQENTKEMENKHSFLNGIRTHDLSVKAIKSQLSDIEGTRTALPTPTPTLLLLLLL